MRRKSLRLALGAEHAARLIEAFQRQIGGGRDLAHGLQHETGRHVGDGEGLGVQVIVTFGQRAPVQRDGDEFEFLAMKDQWRVWCVAHDLELGRHPRCLRVQREIQMDRLDPEIGRLIVGKMDGARFFGAHGRRSG